MVIRIPGFETVLISEKDCSFSSPYFFTTKNKIILEKKTLNQTKGISLREISFPKMPVKPASNTAVCSTRYDFFIIGCLSFLRIYFEY
jgi:hypothetical protein